MNTTPLDLSDGIRADLWNTATPVQQQALLAECQRQQAQRRADAEQARTTALARILAKPLYLTTAREARPTAIPHGADAPNREGEAP